MQDNNRSYRIRTKIGVTEDAPIQDKYLTVKLTDKIDTIEIMSLKIKQENAYKFHCSDYGVVVGRAIANGGFGVPNVKVSIFIAATEATKNDAIYNAIYPYERVTQKNNNIRYNLLPDVGDDECYQVVGTFPNKRLVLDDDNYLEIYDNYYKFTTRTNNAGDYMIFGIPTGGQVLHFDTDLSDVGVLSQKPRDMIYKGYNINQFENANQFKADDNLANLPQIISQDDSVYIYPFWGDEDENVIGITRHDIDINYKFEPTCVFIGSLVSDTNSNHISKKCIPTAQMGMMEELVTGSGTIEMIRKKQNGDIEQFDIQGTQLINDNGVWCYQIPMNLDYAMTDEYGNLVPSNDPTKGIATRASVRFRFSMQDFENDSLNSFRTKVLVPNNPKNDAGRPDYVFGSFTEEESFRDLLWNNVYTVKSFIPRFQKGNGNRNRRFSGIKQCNYYGQNNPIPYNNMRINLSFQFVITCLIVRLLVWIVGVYNSFITALANVLSKFVNSWVIKKSTQAINWLDNWMSGGSNWVARLVRTIVGGVLWTIMLPLRAFKALGDFFRKMVQSLSCLYIDGSMCEALDGTWFFAPNCAKKATVGQDPNNYIWKNMMAKVEGKKMAQVDYSASSSREGGGMVDKQSIDNSNSDDIKDQENQISVEILDDEGQVVEVKTGNYMISRGINYFLQCIEISLAQEFRVVQFDFYNDWVNGMLYIPRWERSLKRKRKYFLFGKTRVEVRACNDNYTKRFFERRNQLTEQCAVSYKGKSTDNSIGTKVGCKNNKKYKCHKKHGRHQFRIFNDGGVVHAELTSSKLYAYYFKPCEYVTNRNASMNRRVNLFATDIVLLGSLVDCDLNGTPLFTNELTSTTYQLPAPLAHTDSTEEGFTYKAVGNEADAFHTDDKFSGIFDIADTVLGNQDDGSVTEESGIDWGNTGPGQGEVKKAKTYTPGGHFLGISCVSAESSIKSCVNLKRICEVNVWPSSRQEVFNGYAGEGSDAVEGTYVDIIPNGFIAKDDISGGNFRRLFSTMNQNGLRTKVNESGFTVYDFEYMSPENFGGDLSKYTRSNYNDPNPIANIDGYLAKNADDVNADGEVWGSEVSETGNTSGAMLKPVRRSLDDRDSDYMRFRLGIDKDNNRNIQSKYLGSDDYGFYMPVYSNSFYFYFGLIPGSTALDEFHKQFFAECKRTMSTNDLRLRMTLHYGNYPEVADAFEEPIEVSIFDTGVTVSASDVLKIYTTALPIKIVVDSDPEKTQILSSWPASAGANPAYMPYTPDQNNPQEKDMFKFGIGKHTITATDSDGKTVTKLVEVVQQKITLCPEVTPIDFSRDTYIINSTKSLVTGQNMRTGNREGLGGWFMFDWENTQCSCGAASKPIFQYKDLDTGQETCVNSDEIDARNLTILFVSKGHIIRVGTAFSEQDIVENYEEFTDYSAGNVFTTQINSSNGDHVYAGEATIYDMYLLYKNGGRTTIMPLLVQEGIEIGEPDAIDFDVFREVLESEDDSPVTFRNPIIKVWFNHPTSWYLYLYDDGNGNREFTDVQIWYIRKTLMYAIWGPDGTKPLDDLLRDYNENFLSERKMYINAFYPGSVGNVICYVNGVQGDKFDLHATTTSTEIKLTGFSEMLGSIQTPPATYGGGKFILPTFYKPYYYKSTVWEGYSPYDLEKYLGHGHVNGEIYNGVVFDVSDSEQAFGPTRLNDTYDLSSDVAVTRMTDDFSAARISFITSDIAVTTLYDATNTLLITEGAPKDYNTNYEPVEYSLEANVIGMASLWNLSFEMNYLPNDKSGRFILTNENAEYEKLVCYWSPNFVLNEENSKLIVETVDLRGITENDAIFKVYESAMTEEYVEFRFPASNSLNGDFLDGSGHGKIDHGVILLESYVEDKMKYLPVIGPPGWLTSRNLVRNNINVDYSVNQSMMAVTVLKKYDMTKASRDGVTRTNRNTKKNRRKVNNLPDPDYYKYAVVGRIAVGVPYIDDELRIAFGQNVSEIRIKIDGDTKEYYMAADLGYTFGYSNNEDSHTGNIIIEMAQFDEDGSADETTVVIDELTKKFLRFLSGATGCELTVISDSFGEVGVDENGEPYNNNIDTITFNYHAALEVTENADNVPDGDDDD